MYIEAAQTREVDGGRRRRAWGGGVVPVARGAVAVIRGMDSAGTFQIAPNFEVKSGRPTKRTYIQKLHKNVADEESEWLHDELTAI